MIEWAVPDIVAQAVAPIRWTVRGFVLIRSYRGETRHRALRLQPRGNSFAYGSGLKPTVSLPAMSSTGRLIIEGCASTDSTSSLTL